MGLRRWVREALGEAPFSGTIFVFPVQRSKRADRVKILAWDGSGLVPFWKRLEHGAFRWPPISDGIMRLTVTASQLAALVDGMDWSRLAAPSTKLVNLWPASRLDELMPWAWAAERFTNKLAA
jgi:transposase